MDLLTYVEGLRVFERDGKSVMNCASLQSLEMRQNWIALRYMHPMGAAVAQWLRCCATNRKVAGSIPPSVSGFFIDIISFRSHYGPGVDSASNRNEYQEHFWGANGAGA